MRIFTALIPIVFILTWGCSSRVSFDKSSLSTGWDADMLGNGFESRYVDQGTDYSGPVRSAIIRHSSECGDSLRRGVLYVHGYNDYFFQKEMASRFADSCYSFYAVDLRKYGRSILPGQQMFEVRDMSEYYADIDSALKVMASDGIDSVVLIGHSTGGLTASAYMNDRKPTQVKKLILNSPFLDWNMGPLMEKVLIPAASWIGGWIPDISIRQPQDSSYAESLLRSGFGNWEFNTDWKLKHARPVTTGWVHAITSAQKKLQRKSDIQVPVLLMHSDKSYSGADTSLIKRADVVLDVDDMEKYGPRLGRDVTIKTIPDGIHDLILSMPDSRENAYETMFCWLRNGNLGKYK
ncbi:alpha/beta hydrolase [uncultured Muribaculum sp.]|uniref:alpha/beta hydrolase n=1 Tax=uncultured Muribaculum sp. TaxID=1918613 RepID=UPI0025B7A0BF|nr:alpha/beta hydrolase [uncultured Muribaculum sp.]